MAVSGIFGWQNIRNIAISLEFPDEIYDGLETMVTVRVRNGKRKLPSFLIRLRIAGNEARFAVIGRSAMEHGSVAFALHGRGLRPVGDICLESSFPINFFIRSRKYGFHRNVVVFPAPRACLALRGMEGKGKLGETAVRKAGNEGELLRIREYTGNEPLKLVHWRISAKHDNLKVKEMTTVTGIPLVIDLDEIPRESLEPALSCCVFLVNRLIRENRPVGLKSGSKLISPGLSNAHRLKILAALAVYDKN